jgi:hypothetical protein
MDNVNQPQGNGPQDHAPTEPQRFTPGDPSPQAYPPPGGQQPDGPWLAGPEPYQQPYQPDPYHQDPGAPGPYAQHPGGPGPYAQPGGPGPYAQQPGGPGPYAQQFGGQYPPPTQQLPGPGMRPPHQKWRWMRSRKVRWAGGIAAAILLSAGGTAAGLALTGSTPPPNDARAVALNNAMGDTTGCSLSSVSKNAGSAAIKADRANLRRCLRTQLHILTGAHGEVAYHTTSGTRTLAFERGSVVSASGGQLTVKAKDGTTWTWSEASVPVIIRMSGKEVNITALQTGTKVFIGGLVNSGNREAKLIIVHHGHSGSGKKAGHSKKAAKPASASGGSSGPLA